jgi:predicted PurR-regulated permease PerM
MSSPPSLSDVLNAIIDAINTILYQVATTIASNAATIGTVLVIGALAFFTMRYGSRIFRGVSRWFSGLLG